MPKEVLLDAYVEVNGVDLSDHFSEITVEDTADEVDLSAFGAGYREFGVGLKDATITGTAFQDFDASKVDATLQPLYASGSTFLVKVRKSKTLGASGTNPVYSMVSKLYSFSPIAGGVGDASTTPITFRNAGTAGLTRGTA